MSTQVADDFLTDLAHAVGDTGWDYHTPSIVAHTVLGAKPEWERHYTIWELVYAILRYARVLNWQHPCWLFENRRDPNKPLIMRLKP